MITFIGLGRRTSGKIRGKQISDKIEGSNFFDYSEVASNLDKINKIVVVVRNRSLSIERHLKDRGHILGYDVLDSAGSDLYFRNKVSLHSDFIDNTLFSFYIVNNKLAQLQMYENFLHNEKAYVIPHHHVNFSQQRSYSGELDIKYAGYIGLPEQLTDRESIKSILQKYNITLLENPGHDYKETCESLSKIQLGITNMKNEFTDTFKKCKPNTKLSNYQSYGIITLCNDSVSFKEFGNNSYFKHENLEEFEYHLKLLTKDKELRIKISDESYEHSKLLHIDNVVKNYDNIIKDFSK